MCARCIGVSCVCVQRTRVPRIGVQYMGAQCVCVQRLGVSCMCVKSVVRIVRVCIVYVRVA